MPSDNSRSSRPSSGRPSRPGGRGGSGRPSGSSGKGSGGRSGGGQRGPADDRRARRDAGEGRSSGGRTSGGAPRKYTKGDDRPRRDRDDTEPIPGNRQWGGLARKGVLRANADERTDAEFAAERRLRDEELDPEELAKREARQARREAREQRTAELREEAKAAVARTGVDKPKPKRKPRAKPARERAVLPDGPARSGEAYELFSKMFGAADAKKHMRKVGHAAEAYEAERFADAKRILKPLLELAPHIPELRELQGLILYRQGKYRAAVEELEEFRTLAATAEQNPVMMDCYRAQGRWADVSELWTELAEVSPGAGIVNEGRIVMANALAEQNKLGDAVTLLEKGWKRPSKPHEHHLRRAYALADLYERSGDAPRARALFEWLAAKAPDFVDVRQRLRNLR